jgi:hypothetical protein
MFAPVMDLNGIGPRVTKDTITDVWMSPFPSYEDLEIKNQTRACHAAQYNTKSALAVTHIQVKQALPPRPLASACGHRMQNIRPAARAARRATVSASAGNRG